VRQVTGLSPDVRFDAWYATLQASLRSLDRIAGDFERETGIPLAWYEVLIRAYKADGQRIRMSELATTLLLSRGGATRLVDRMEEAGLITREIPPEDRRATYAVLTEKGREEAERGKPVHFEIVDRHFGSLLDEEEARTLVRASLKVIEREGDQCAWLVDALCECAENCTCGEGGSCAVHAGHAAH
jgi:DNA-binding MarR family transcriptional regulator